MSDTMLVPAMTGEELATAPLLPTQLVARLARIQTVMRQVMEDGIDYGKIPGTDKPSIFKPGAEKLAVTFHLGIGDPIVTDLGDGYERRYRVSVPVLAPTGVVLAVGVGECSSEEDKYAWRRPNHQKEYDAAPADRRRIKYQRNGEEWNQVRTNPADVSNTILKMAHKRAYIHGIVMATGAGSIFGQDLEDLEAGVLEAVTSHDGTRAAKPAMQAPQRKSAAAPTTTTAVPADATAGAVYVTNVKAVTKKKRDGTEMAAWDITFSTGKTIDTIKEKVAEQAKNFGQHQVPLDVVIEKNERGYDVLVEMNPMQVREAGSDPF